MASVKSLGVHLPSGLHYAVESDILPEDPSPSSYTWEYFVDSTDGQEREDELLTTETCVIWSRGGSMRRIFSFDVEKEPITQALLTYFPTSDGPRDGSKSREYKQFQGLSRALVVFLKTQAHIHFLSGTSYVVHMPFEVESACAAPCGVVIQRKLKADNLAPVSLRFPRIPPNSFVSSQPFAAASQNRLPNMTFSTEGLGKPRTLPLRLSSTLENMWQPTLEPSESHWPRLVCLMDPLHELGLVVTHQDKQWHASGPRRSSAKSPFLDPAEEILHIEEVRLPPKDDTGNSVSAVVAVTANPESNSYSVWKMTYIRNEDIFTSRTKKTGMRESTRRRSSMPPTGANGANTPIQPRTRESFGATLPGKKPRPAGKAEKQLDALSSLDPEKGGEVTRRASRRVSSVLARGDLSASQDRSSFADPPLVAGQSHAGRRVDSRGSMRGRASGNGMSFSGTFHQLNSLPEAPVDNLLGDLKAGGDFDGFHTMGLDDHDFDGLAREIMFTKIKTVPMDNANVRYSMSNKPAKAQCSVFVLLGSPYTTDEQGRTQLVVGIQDPVDKRLSLLLFYVEHGEGMASAGSAQKSNAGPSDSVTVTYSLIRKANGVVDSCKLLDGDQSMILILSEGSHGERELSLQAPWSPLTTLALPALFQENLDSLDFAGEYADEDAASRRLVGINGTGININGLRNPQLHGIVDIRDGDGTLHRVRIQLQPSVPQVRKVLDACQSVLPAAHAEKMLATWWHIMQWRAGMDPVADDLEWSSLVILLFGSFLVLGNLTDPADKRKGPRPRLSMSTSGVAWRAMQEHDISISAACPSWMHSKGWEWMAEEGVTEDINEPDFASKNGDTFITTQIALAREFLASHPGLATFGSQSSLATAAGSSPQNRRMAAWSIIMALHLLLEEQRLSILTSEDVPQNDAYLKVVVAQICRWLGWRKYSDSYELSMEAGLSLSSAFNCDPAHKVPESPYQSIYDWIQYQLTGATGQSGTPTFPSLLEVFRVATDSTQTSHARKQIWDSTTPRTLMFSKLFTLLTPRTSSREMVEAMYQCGFTPDVLETLPEAILAPLQDAIFLCQPNPPAAWSQPLLELVHRTDVSSVFKSHDHVRSSTAVLSSSHNASWDVQLLCQSADELGNTTQDEGEAMERQAVVRALFKEDRRLNEAQNLLSSQKPRVVKLDARPEWSESEYLEKQKELATTVATGTLAIPAGRGLLYYALRYPILTQRFHIGGFNLSVVVRPTNVTVGIDKSLFTEEKINWAFFHQGVAGGLAISPHAKGIDTSWILYNRPAQDLSNRYAGFLLALGLNGHLKSVAKWVAFKYLTPKHTMTSVGLLLGLAASYIGTMDSLITRLLSVHVTRMLPRGAAELNLSRHVQTTGVMGIGLLYCNSQHRRMSEIMLSEIEHIDDDEEEDPLRDEGYRLAAGFALGFINLGKGSDLKGLYDMRLTEKLLTIATATKKVELVHVLDRSAAGAVMAIALIFMKSDDHIVARKIDVPDSVLQFDYIRPDILLLRTLAKHIIMWSSISPSFEFVKASLPAEYRPRASLKTVTKLQSSDLPFFSILAGICFAIALRFAGSGNHEVRDLLIHYLDEFIRIVRIPTRAPISFDAELARSNARMCMDLLSLSAATVMAGSGDIEVLRRLRSLHGRDDPSTTYGSHLAAHLAIGALFLGCGTATFGTSNKAIASLLVAFYPLFPARVQDNRSHLQAFRHFWTLAVEHRCLVTKDVLSGTAVSVPLIIHLKSLSLSASGNEEEGRIVRKTTPCLLPPLDDIASIQTDAEGLGYWDISLNLSSRPELAEAFKENQSIYLRRRPAVERPFASTVQALGRRGNIPPETATGVEGGDGPDGPMEWVFGLKGLKGLTYAERGVVMDLNEAGGGSGLAVDAGLVLKGTLDGGGVGRDGLLGLKLLFAWGDRRRKVFGLEGKEVGADGSQSTVRDVKGKGREMRTEAATKERDAEGSSVSRDAWWMRDSVIDMLKGQAWLASRDD
jgi:anaphase-promoting complex subunit 1